MKKGFLCLFALTLLVTLAACGTSAPKGEITTAVTWEELLAANEPQAVLEKAGGFWVSATDGGDETYNTRVALIDGDLVVSTGNPGFTEDLRGGIQYRAPEDGNGKSVTILAPTTDPLALLDDICGEDLRDYQTPDNIYVNDEYYFAKLYMKEEELGATATGYVYFDVDTLLLDHMETTISLFGMKYSATTSMSYENVADFPTVSYDRIVHAEDTVDVTIHFPDGTTKDVTLARDVEVSIFHPGQEVWSVCWDEACTGSVDYLSWISGDHGDLYLCQDDVPDAAPLLSDVLQRSSFERMFKDNYDTYFQTTDIMDKDTNTIQVRDLAWYVDEEAGLCLNFEIKDQDYNVIQSGRARDNAWYTWTEEAGYAVDFFAEFSYAEEQVKGYRRFLYEEQLGAPMEKEEEYAPYYIPYEETVGNGEINEYKFRIHPDSRYIEMVSLTRKDSNGNVLGYENCYIGGNGPIAGELDIFAQVSDPDDADAVKLTVVTPTGEKTYSIRQDATISWEGQALYRDEARTQAVTDLSWVTASKATVYAK